MPTFRSAQFNRPRDLLALLAIAGVFAISWLLVNPLADVPLVDDWVYAWSVEQLVTIGRLQVLDISAVYPVAQILWGGLFASIAGFSFAVLRLSTIVLAFLGSCAVYLALRELGCRQSTSLIGALALAFDPVYFALSFSFMTDVPFASLSAMTIYFYIRAIHRETMAPLWIGSALAVAAFLVRPIGILLPLALAIAPAGGSGWRKTIRRRAAPVAIALIAMAALQMALPKMFGRLTGAGMRQEWLEWWFTVPISDYVRWTIRLAFESAFPFAPLLLAYCARSRRALAVSMAALLLAVVCYFVLGELAMPLQNGQTWSLQEFSARSMIDGDVAPSAWSIRVTPVVKVIGLLTTAALLVVAVRSLFVRGADLQVRRGADFADLQVRRDADFSRHALLLVVGLGLLHAAAINALWLFSDRYYLVFAPGIAILAAQALDDAPRAKWLAAVFLAGLAAVCVTGARDMIGVNAASAAAARELEASGVPPWEIDAGYSLNGWRLYAHPEHLAPGADRLYEVPYVTSKKSPRYSIVNSPLPNAVVLRTMPLDRATWQATCALYVVRRN